MSTTNSLRAIVPALPFVSVGCDPEFFIRVNGELVSAISLFPGNKKLPQPLLDPITNKELGTVIHDNVAVEFTMPPAISKEKFASQIMDIRVALLDILKIKFKRGSSIELDSAGAAVFPDKLLVDPEALEFGCDPDFDAWDNGAEKVPPSPAEVGGLRAIGGHVHIGYLPGASEKVEALLKDDYGKVIFIQLMDMSVGQAVAHEERVKKKAVARFVRRRSMYGAAGSFRPKSYGVEYRSPSSVWCTSRFCAEEIYQMIQVVCGIIDRSKNPYTLPADILSQVGVKEDDVIDSINKSKPIMKLLHFFRYAERE